MCVAWLRRWSVCDSHGGTGRGEWMPVGDDARDHAGKTRRAECSGCCMLRSGRESRSTRDRRARAAQCECAVWPVCCGPSVGVGRMASCQWRVASASRVARGGLERISSQFAHARVCLSCVGVRAYLQVEPGETRRSRAARLVDVGGAWPVGGLCGCGLCAVAVACALPLEGAARWPLPWGRIIFTCALWRAKKKNAGRWTNAYSNPFI